MSKLRQQVAITEGDVTTPEEGDLAPYVVFTRLKPGGPFIYAGWLDAADDTMAMHFACEHYGQDQQCVRVAVIARPALASTDGLYPTPDDKGAVRSFSVFRQKIAGDAHRSIAGVEADSSAAALGAAKAIADIGEWSCLWVVDDAKIVLSDTDEVVWRHTDQNYRLARGYAADVRAKWEKVRAERDLEEYEKEDLKDAF